MTVFTYQLFSEIKWNALCKTQVKWKLKCVFPFVVGGNYNRAAKRGADSLQSQTQYRRIHHISFVLSPLKRLLTPVWMGVLEVSYLIELNAALSLCTEGAWPVCGTLNL